MSYIVMERTCSGIQEDELKAEHFTAEQESVLQQLDAAIQDSIRRDKPYTVMDLKSKRTICAFNHKM